MNAVLHPLRLAAARLRHQRERAAFLAVGVGAGTAMLAAVLGTSMIVRQQALERALADVPVADRAVYASFFGIPRGGGRYTDLDRTATRALTRLSRRPPVRAMQLRVTRIGTTLVNLGALDDMGRHVDLRSGRLPRRCEPQRCEVVELAAGVVPSAPGIRLVRVGTGVLRSSLAFSRLPGAEGELIGDSGELPEKPAFVVAEGIEALSSLPELESAYRTYVWALPVGPELVRPWELRDFAAEVDRARSAVETQSVFFDLTAPVDELRAADRTSRVGARRLLLVGGQGAVLLLAFAVFAAARMRRDVDAAWRRLTWFGARRWQLVLTTIAEVSVPAATGVAVGWAVGAAIVASLAGDDAAATLRHSVLSTGGIVTATAALGIVVAALLLALRAPVLTVRGFALTPTDVAALASVVVVVVAAGRGALDAQELARTEATGAILLALPALVAFAGAVAIARLLGPALRLLERATRGGGARLRLAVLSLARAPGTAAVATAFLAVGVGLAAAAIAYRETLERGRVDQARYAVPADLVVRERLDPTGLVAPLEAAPPREYAAAARDGAAMPVFRVRASVTRGSQLTLLGVDASSPVARGLDGWRDDFAERPLSELLRAIDTDAADLVAPVIPRDARTLSLPARFDGDEVVVSAPVLTTRGTYARLRFARTASRPLTAAVPREARGGRLLGFELATDPRTQHSSGVLDGTLTLGAMTAHGRDAATVVESYDGWIGRGGVRVAAPGVLRYIVTDQSDARFRPRQPREGAPVPAVVSPRLAAAAADRILPLRLPRGEVAVEIVGTAARFPSVTGDFVVTSASALADALDPDEPGAAVPNEIWFDAGDDATEAAVARRLSRPPFDVLDVSRRRTLEAELRADPVARGTLLALAGAAIVSLLVALLGVVLAVRADVRDESRELADLEAEGVTPAELRQHVRFRAAVTAVVGVAAGTVIAVVLAAATTSLVALTAAGGIAEPPLRLGLDWRLLVLGALAFAAAAAAVVTAASATALPEPR